MTASSPSGLAYHAPASAGTGGRRRVSMAASLVALMLLAGCEKSPETTGVANEAIDTPLAPAAPVEDRATSNEADAAGDGSTAAGALPMAMRGVWAGPDEDCADQAAVHRLEVTGDRLRFYESEGVVERVTRESATAVSADIAYSGEGQTWKRTQTLRLSPDGDRLTVGGMGSDFVRKRCP